MMNHTLKNHLCKLPTGTIITGKWHRKAYKMIKLLGNGANGVVYLAESQKGLVAIKLSDNNTTILSEVNVLKRFSKVQGAALGPSLLDVDDWLDPSTNRLTPFYVMEYIKGEEFFSFIKKRGKEWMIILILQLLSALDKLHKEGWVFGDLKPENLLVAGMPPTIRLLDVGGTTLQGRAIKEFTEFYDRGYWGLGSRKADPAYDLFAVAMMMIHVCYPTQFTKKENARQQLLSMIEADATLRKYRKALMKAIDGTYKQAIEMKRDLVAAIHHSDLPPKEKHVPPQTIPSSRSRKKRRKAKKRRGGVIETAFIAAILLFVYVLYLYGQVL
ncbi:kinase domain protein [Anoxybacillus sp. B7M1]|uniref:Protein kinase n=1 Tax=Anoxybacteroides rupiense TaxID=311460 RepID=A0ABD5IWA1_9BACL|nr:MULTISPECIES: protein kinase [Anoxybacillus]ANB57655.1 kinase domain protein [Anoxybacillus sp. B2M1]ANB65821.1 kinase domain protein [Anoxybacillus sp. B7M1]KXG08251.1 putative serine/threonine-protein kinase YabT [Anoxybacillus sp. P3H1B]MBB3909143.1 serine/threonine-protein kinase [Anoxybacillus rupiensis]MDE8565385.1 protein kinase [Anoxybacillus rupiensis]